MLLVRSCLLLRVLLGFFLSIALPPPSSVLLTLLRTTQSCHRDVVPTTPGIVSDRSMVLVFLVDDLKANLPVTLLREASTLLSRRRYALARCRDNS